MNLLQGHPGASIPLAPPGRPADGVASPAARRSYASPRLTEREALDCLGRGDLWILSPQLADHSFQPSSSSVGSEESSTILSTEAIAERWIMVALSGRVAIVTGAGSGIGRATAIA